MNYLSREECKQIQINILLELDKICRKENLHYYIAYGTLLGAVRHGGFIPWDDDIDICMLRKDYERLLDIVKGGACDWIAIADGDCKGYYLPFAKAVDKNTCTKQEDSLLEHGIWVDILPLDGIPAGGLMQKSYLLGALFLRNTLLSGLTDFNTEKTKKDPKRNIKKILSVFCRLCGGVDKVLKFTENYMRKYDYNKTQTVGCLGTPYITKEVRNLGSVRELTDYAFEGFRFRGVKDYDLYLSMLYNNYMQLPPEDKRRTHSITAWYINDNVDNTQVPTPQK